MGFGRGLQITWKIHPKQIPELVIPKQVQNVREHDRIIYAELHLLMLLALLGFALVLLCLWSLKRRKNTGCEMHPGGSPQQ